LRRRREALVEDRRTDGALGAKVEEEKRTTQRRRRSPC
jgi:hypothetical protein